MDSGLSDYRSALDALFARSGSTSRFGIERTVEFLSALGDPQRRYPVFHVAGTNGKGSVVATLFTLLRAKGLRVARYTSPHLIDFRERIIVDDEPIDEEHILAFLERWLPHAESIGATFFEITTAMAFHDFAARDVDVAIIETGLGGRLDATNVVDPLVAGITSIALDHQEYLGTTEGSIAREKAGIIKKDRPAVIGPLSAEARKAVEAVAHNVGASRVIEAVNLFAPRDVHVTVEGTSFVMRCGTQEREMTTGLVGVHQVLNTSVALAMLDAAGGKWKVSLDDAASSLPSVTLKGRFQRLGRMIFDVAHNPDGIKSLVETLESADPQRPVSAVLGVLSDKDWRGMITALAGAVDTLTLVAPPSAPASRAWNPLEAVAFAIEKGIDARYESDFAAAIRAASLEEGTTLITGSFHTVGDALRVLGEKTL